jgi:hypothetical protein
LKRRIKNIRKIREARCTPVILGKWRQEYCKFEDSLGKVNHPVSKTKGLGAWLKW